MWNITNKISEQTTEKETYVDIENRAVMRQGKTGEGDWLYGDGRELHLQRWHTVGATEQT